MRIEETSLFYSIRHMTRFRYDAPVQESLMEVRMHPRTEGPQRCINYNLHVDPRTRVHVYKDYLGNSVHHFDVPGRHLELRILSEALVEIDPLPELPDKLAESAWQEIDEMVANGDYWETLMQIGRAHV